MDQVEEIKKRIDIVEFITQYLQLRKVGINHSACCPFHDEKSPSFMVSAERQTFKCFGCGEGGDVITFFQKIEGLSFPEALRTLGDRVGVQISFKNKEESQKEKSDRDTLLKINLTAAKYFKSRLITPEGKKAYEYLTDRGLSQETIEKMKIGYADGSFNLQNYFTKSGISSYDLSKAGHPERFRYRIMFPIFDVIGEVIGFSGRILESVLPENFSPHPKYLNTPETNVFHKSKILYGINFAKEAIRKTKRVVVVEGQMDVCMSHEAGIHEVVATSGTALTQDHLRILKRYSENVIFAFDEDEAGQKAAISAINLALENLIDCRLTIIEGYKDAGEMAREDKKAWKETVDKALPPIEWLIRKSENTKKSLTGSDKKTLAAQALKFISKMKDEIEKAHYTSVLAKYLMIPEISVEKALQNIESKMKETTHKASEEKKEPDIEEDYLSFVINFSEILGGLTLSQEIKFKNIEYDEIYKQVLKCYNSKEKKKDLDSVKKNLPRQVGESLAVSSQGWDLKVSEDKASALNEFIAIKNKLQEDEKELIKQNFAKLIAEAESSGNLEEVKNLMKKLQQNL